MFGGNNAWGSSQQNQQQQQQPQQQGGGLFGQTANAFGQPAAPPAFGATGTTGFGAQPQQQSGGLFGAAQPTPASTGFGFGASTTTNHAFGQQPQRPGFGGTGTSLFGGNTSNTTTPGFGGFGTNQQPQPTGNIGIGGMNNPAPATGGMFGAGSTGSTFGSTGFGSKPATTGFGASATTSGGLFGQKSAVSSPFGQSAAQQQKPAELGQWQPYKEKDNATANSITNVFHTITAHPQYRDVLVEELRLKDYMEGRKTAPANTGATGGMSIFGASQPQQTSTFGQPASGQASTGFGAPAQQSGGLFGQSTSTFGQSTGGFGQAAPATSGFGAAASNPFGQNQQQQQGSSLFGQPANNAASNPFGASTTTPAFGQPAQPATSFGFGQNNDANKPAGGFGFGSTTQPASGGLFGQQNNTAAAPASSGFSFGQPQQNQAQPASGGFSFGTTPAATQTPGTSLFGASNTTQQPSTGGLFGQPANNAAKPSLFGQPAQSGTSGSLFGGGFGTNNTTQQQPGNTAANPFGASTTGTSLFGQPQQNQQQAQQPSTSLFGGGFGATQNKPATGGLFGAPAAPQQPAPGGGFSFGNAGQQQQQQQQPGSLFGGSTNQQNQAPSTGFGAGSTGNSLFGAPKPAGGLFGGGLGTSTNNAGGASNGLFGQSNNQTSGTGDFGFGQQSAGLFNSQSQPGQQLQQSQQGQPLSAISSDPYGSSGFFSIPSIPQGSNQTVGDLFALPQPVAKSLPPLSSSSRGTPSVMRSSTKLRGFANPQGAASPRPTLSSSSLGLKVNAINSSIFDSPSATHLDANAFTPRPSVKKLVIEKKSTPQDRLLNGSRSRTDGDRSHLVLDGGDNESTFVESVTAGSEQGGDSVSPMPRRAARSPSRGPSSGNKLNQLPRKIDLSEIPEDEYYTIPDMSVLANAGHEELAEVREFVVGRKGWGELRYKKPVNLNEVPELRDIPGTLVQFEERMQCEVYPEDAGDAKRPPGQGLNQPARITIEQCWPKDPSSGEPIKDPEHPRMKIRRRKIQSLPDTTFVAFEPVEGRAIFEVEHFTKYGVDSDDGEDEVDQGESDGLDYNEDDAPLNRRSRSRSIDDLPPQRTLRGMNDNGASDGVSDDSASMSTDETDGAPLSARDTPSRAIADIPAEAFNRSAVELMRQSLFVAPVLETMPSKRSMLGCAGKSDGPHFVSAERGTGGTQGVDTQGRASFGVSRKPTGGLAPPYKLVKIATKDSLSRDKEGLMTDAGLSSSRVFRAGWNRDNQIACYGNLGGPSAQSSPTALDRLDIVVPSHMTDFGTSSARQMLDVLRQQSAFALDDGVPRVSVSGHLAFSTHADLQRGPSNAQLLRILRLGRALFDDLASVQVASPGSDMPEKALRKAALSSWLKAEVKASVERDVVATPMGPARVFAHLSGHDVEAAVSVASEAGDQRLAVLLAQADGSEAFKQRMRQQLTIWQTSLQTSHIEPAYRKVYAVLSGETAVLPGVVDRDPINAASQIEVDSGLDWLRTFGLHLWYGTALDASIEDALHSYQSALGDHRTTPRPHLPDSQAIDAVFSMLELFCDLNKPLDEVLRPAGLGVSRLDVSGQWHLQRILAAAKPMRRTADQIADKESSTTADKLTIDYATQLEAVGMWVDAAFVLMHLSNPVGRCAALKRLIGSHGDQLNDDTARTLVEQYQIPLIWLESARADLARDQGRVYDEYHHSLAAEMYDRAHDLAINDLLPEVIIRSDNALVRKLISPFIDKPVETWNAGGRVLLAYVKLCENAPARTTKKGRSADFDESVKAARLVKAALPALFRRNFDGELALDHAAAIEIMFTAVTRIEGLLRRTGPVETSNIVPDSISESERLRTVESATRDGFMAKLQECW